MDVSLVLERDGGERSGGGGIRIGDSIRWYVAHDSNEDGAVFFSSPRMSCFGVGRRATGMSGLLPGRRGRRSTPSTGQLCRRARRIYDGKRRAAMLPGRTGDEKQAE